LAKLKKSVPSLSDILLLGIYPGETLHTCVPGKKSRTSTEVLFVIIKSWLCSDVHQWERRE
jgi:hypothetical protein